MKEKSVDVWDLVEKGGKPIKNMTKSLQTIQARVWSIDHALSTGSPETASSILRQVISTIRTPSFSKIMVLYWWDNFCGVEPWRHPDWPPLREMSEAERTEEASQHSR